MEQQEEKKLAFSNEFNNLMTFIRENLSKELPTLNIDIDYFILGIFVERKSNIFRRLNMSMLSTTIDQFYSTWYSTVSSKALTAVKANRVPTIDGKLAKMFIDSEDIAKDMGSDEITTEHVFLAILNNNEDNNKVKKAFNKAGITYNILRSKMLSDGNDKIESNAKKQTLRAFIGIFDTLDDLIKSRPTGNVGESGLVLSENMLFSWTVENNVGAWRPYESMDKIPNGEININGPGNTRARVFNFKDKKSAEDFLSGIFDGSIDVNDPGRPKHGGRSKFISQYCVNLNELAEQGKIEPLVGREKETNEIIRILGRKKKNNMILVGGEGVGKTAIAEALANKIINKEVPEFLSNKVLVSLDMTALMAGTTLRGMFEERVKGVLDEVKADKNYILFMDNIGAMLADKGKNDYEISAMLSRALESGEIQVIGTSDFASYRKTFDKDPSLARRFQKIIVEAPTVNESLEILRALKASYEDFHVVKYDDEAVDACVYLADRYIKERNLPDSAIDILDEIGAMIGTMWESDALKKKRSEIVNVEKDIEKAKVEKEYDKVDELMENEKALKKEYNSIKKKDASDRKKNPPHITKDDILNIVSIKTGIPVNNLTSDDKERLVTMNDRLKSEVIGQDEAIDTICKALKRNRIGLHKGGCMYSAIMIGKSGVGKTLIAKKLAKELFGDENNLVRFDMSEYSDKVSVNKLIGSNPGYVGYEEGGQLTETIKNKKHCVLLLDEIEKADPEVYNIFLQVLDEGFLSDNSGMRVDFKNVIVLFTSNIGTKAATEFSKGIGFSEDEGKNSKKILMKQLKGKFPPEFLNRLDNIIYFNSLSDDNLKQIIRLELDKFIKNLGGIGYKCSYDDKVVDFLFNIVTEQKEFGARPIMRAIQENIEDTITDLLLEKDYDNGYKFKATTDKKMKHVVVR